MPPEYIVALKTFAFPVGVPLAEYACCMVHAKSSKEVPLFGEEVPL